MALKGSTNEEKIWNFLIGKGLSAHGVAGLMGNLYAESGLRPDNLQNCYERPLGYSDEAYTKATDSGAYPRFELDGAGYGLAQWTYSTRKAALLRHAKASGRSVGDLECQLDFLWVELSESYTGVLSVLRTASTVKAASDIVLTQFERPADMGDSVKATRTKYGQKYYDQYANKEETKMSYTNSSLVNFTVKSPNHSGTRTHKIDRITPHCVVGQLTAEGIGNCFPSGREASCNYGIGKDGRVCLIVDEQNRSWCSSSNANDQRAITIECASDSEAPYAFNTAVYNKLVALCADICKRNGLKKVLWIGDKTKALNYEPSNGECLLTVHRWFANKSCPGDWLYNRMGQLATDINAAIGGKTVTQTTENKTGDTVYTVKSGDTLSGIAAKYGTTYQAIAQYNGIANPNVISVGQKIKIPGNATQAETWTPKVGDIVQYNGNVHYTGANATNAKSCTGGQAKITSIYQLGKSKHPYHLIRVAGKGATVYGWVDAGTFTKA